MRSPQYRQLAHELQDRTLALLLGLLRPTAYSKRCTALVLLCAGLELLAALGQLLLNTPAVPQTADPSQAPEPL